MSTCSPAFFTACPEPIAEAAVVARISARTPYSLAGVKPGLVAGSAGKVAVNVGRTHIQHVNIAILTIEVEVHQVIANLVHGLTVLIAGPMVEHRSSILHSRVCRGTPRFFLLLAFHPKGSEVSFSPYTTIHQHFLHMIHGSVA